MKPARLALGLLSLLVASACASSRAEPVAATPASPSAYGDSDRPVSEGSVPLGDSDRPVVQRVMPWADPTPPPYSPYGVELLGGDFHPLPRFLANGRAYVLGTIGDRYRIRISNPTSRRVEAVVSVDGLDAIDGRTASYQDKRGYVIGPYGDITIEGFRTSLDQVATFRFSSVRDSYAGRKGQDRNVGVIGVAFFPERERPAYRIPRPLSPDERARRSDVPPAPRAAPADRGTAAGRSSAAPAPSAESKRSADDYGSRSMPAPESRPGLGTEFGEQRYSSVGYTNFQRENPARPNSVVELR